MGISGVSGDSDGLHGPVVHAAGCVLWRRSPVTGALEICLVHRPKGPTTLVAPQGQAGAQRGAPRGCAARGRRETGSGPCRALELPTARYAVDGRPKQVRYWAAEAVAGTFVPSREVDRVLWLAPDAARARPSPGTAT
ncbi:DNA mismatch repair protein MutT OS=Streptomyces fumanus OX=67302 GN=GCM10018772_29150 PE=4 SV=1 [Streptomyces fumanus]